MSHNDLIRQGVATDAAAIRDLTRAAYAKWVPVIGREPKPMTADYSEALRNNRFDLLFIDGTLAALIETIPHADHLLIENVAVSPSCQGQGLGTKLMAHAEHMASASGLPEIRLYTNMLFAENVRLYRKLGYKIDRQEDFRGGVAIFMSKPVHP
jgi:ribosomal protein S18 acetylase RimI-like enzyme